VSNWDQPFHLIFILCQVDLPEFFVESWTYSSALSVVDQCDVWAVDHKPDDSDLPSFNAGKGELLELALNQVRYSMPSTYHITYVV
jgi:hypothetical protein